MSNVARPLTKAYSIEIGLMDVDRGFLNGS
jgi:hypothetical protein